MIFLTWWVGCFPGKGFTPCLWGGHAVNAHGFTRATVDVDFMIVSNQEEKVKSLIFASKDVESELRKAWESPS